MLYHWAKDTSQKNYLMVGGDVVVAEVGTCLALDETLRTENAWPIQSQIQQVKRHQDRETDKTKV